MNITTKNITNKLPRKPGEKYYLALSSFLNQCFFISKTIEASERPVIIITSDIESSNRIIKECEFFLEKERSYSILEFPDLEILPYDHFSAHQDIISDRLLALYKLPYLKKGALVVSVNALMQYLPPKDYIESNSLMLKCKDTLNIDDFRNRLEAYGYRCVDQVMEHGEFSVRGSLFDLFPMGSSVPYRIDLNDDIVDSIRIFDSETQISTTKVDSIELLPAKEFPLTKDSISHFRQMWRDSFSGDPTSCSLYQNISRGENSPGVEYYLKLFFNSLSTLFDYVPQNSLVLKLDGVSDAAEIFIDEVKKRYEYLRHDKNRPILAPHEIFLTVDKLNHFLNQFPQIHCISNDSILSENAVDNTQIIKSKCAYEMLPDLFLDRAKENPFEKLCDFLNVISARVLFCAVSKGKRESLLKLLDKVKIYPNVCENWNEFVSSSVKIGITVASLEEGAYLCKETLPQDIVIITESQLFGPQIISKKERRSEGFDPDSIIRNLIELHVGDPVVHIEHGVGFYRGLEKLKTDEDAMECEFLKLEYDEKALLYVPVTALHLIRRYNCGKDDVAKLNRLGSKQWKKTKSETIKKVRDIALELLQIYAKREKTPGFAFQQPGPEYDKFSSSFPFDPTEDQEKAIEATIIDMISTRAMDRIICGDVGFGKTEIAMRAAFLAVTSNKQVAILTPTTLLAEQHYHNFVERFSDWPVHIEMLSRFCKAKEQNDTIDKIADGKVDIIIGTHKLLQPRIKFKNLGLLVIDEEHRFGVAQKEKIKALRPNIDVLTLTATPIPRTLNMALSGIRDFSIISTPPPGRLSIKTFINERNDYVLRESILREIMRGGQVYFVHNEVKSIHKVAKELEALVPNARVSVAHGQMHELELEKVMGDFYHRKFNVLVCTTIIESGLDVPTANTIIINRADQLGLAQLHQLRGRVGRSCHQAYAYLLIPSLELLTKDASKRLDALISMGDLGVGFMLATHDLEIRGAGELLGEEQSGEILALGFDLYMEYLEKAVIALKDGDKLNLDLEEALDSQLIEVDLKIPAFIPDNYIIDVNTRLIFYKRISGAKTLDELESIEAELVDRFGLLKEEIRNLFSSAEIKLLASPLGVSKIVASVKQGSIAFFPNPNINFKNIMSLVQSKSDIYKISGGTKLDFKKQHKTAKDLIEFIKGLFKLISTA